MGQQEYSLQKRKNSKGKTVYYVQFKDVETGKYLTARSTGQSSQTAAHQWAILQLSQGSKRPLSKVPLFKNYALDFFDLDTSDYVKDKLLFTQKSTRSLGTNHANNQGGYLKNYLLPHFGEKRLDQIGSEQIRQFQIQLRDQGLSAQSVNHIVSALSIILKWACERGVLNSAPVFRRMSGKVKQKDVLDLEEIRLLFESEWSDPRHRALNMLACTTGMRMGEILGLQRKAVQPGLVEVYASWDRAKLKGTMNEPGTKTGKSRIIPIPARTQAEVDALMKVSPWKDPDDFVFYSEYKSSPVGYQQVPRVLYAQLEKIGITGALRAERNVTFHSWRHFYNSLLINAKIPTFKVQTLTGHSSDAMTANYFHAEDFADVLTLTQGILAQKVPQLVQVAEVAV